MSSVTAGLEQTASIEQEPFDFEAFLAFRWGVERHQVEAVLGRWMLAYRPVSPRSSEPRSRPGPSGVFACQEPPTDGPVDEVDVA